MDKTTVLKFLEDYKSNLPNNDNNNQLNIDKRVKFLESFMKDFLDNNPSRINITFTEFYDYISENFPNDINLIGMNAEEGAYDEERVNEFFQAFKKEGYQPAYKEITINHLPMEAMSAVRGFLDDRSLKMLSMTSKRFKAEHLGEQKQHSQEYYKNQLLNENFEQFSKGMIQNVINLNVIKDYKKLYLTLTNLPKRLIEVTNREFELLFLTGEKPAIEYAIKNDLISAKDFNTHRYRIYDNEPKHHSNRYDHDPLFFIALSGNVSAMEMAVKQLKCSRSSIVLPAILNKNLKMLDYAIKHHNQYGSFNLEVLYALMYLAKYDLVTTFEFLNKNILSKKHNLLLPVHICGAAYNGSLRVLKAMLDSKSHLEIDSKAYLNQLRSGSKLQDVPSQHSTGTNMNPLFYAVLGALSNQNDNKKNDYLEIIQLLVNLGMSLENTIMVRQQYINLHQFIEFLTDPEAYDRYLNSISDPKVRSGIDLDLVKFKKCKIHDLTILDEIKTILSLPRNENTVAARKNA